MCFKFNLQDEPWIPVVGKNGEHFELGIRETLLRAHELLGVSHASPLIEYGVYRLLITYLLDMLHPESVVDIEDLLEKRAFSRETILDYETKCTAEGVSFDLFDEKRPFLQAAPNPDLDLIKKSVFSLNCSIPTGNNHTHFDHLNQGDGMTFSEVALLLVPSSLFATAGVQKYPSSINGVPPFFTVIKGKNLFETLVFQLIPSDERQDPIEKPVFWRGNQSVEPTKIVNETSLLYGLLFPARRIRLIPSDDGLVREVFISQGENFIDSQNWTDPYVTYRFNEKTGRFPWRPKKTKAIWQNLCDLIDSGNKLAPLSIRLYQRIFGRKPDDLTISLYGVETEKASYLQLFYQDLTLPSQLLAKPSSADLVRFAISKAEGVSKELRDSLSQEDIPDAVAAYAVQSLFDECEKNLWKLLRLISAEGSDDKTCIEFWFSELVRTVHQVSEKTIDSLKLKGSALITIYEKQTILYRKTNSILKEVKNGEKK